MELFSRVLEKISSSSFFPPQNLTQDARNTNTENPKNNPKKTENMEDLLFSLQKLQKMSHIVSSNISQRYKKSFKEYLIIVKHAETLWQNISATIDRKELKNLTKALSQNLQLSVFTETTQGKKKKNIKNLTIQVKQPIPIFDLKTPEGELGQTYLLTFDVKKKKIFLQNEYNKNDIITLRKLSPRYMSLSSILFIVKSTANVLATVQQIILQSQKQTQSQSQKHQKKTQKKVKN